MSTDQNSLLLESLMQEGVEKGLSEAAAELYAKERFEQLAEAV